MLNRLEVRDLAVIESAELELGLGFTTLTGETGAGKSLLVDALGLVLGDRGSASLVRDGAKRARVSAEFDLPQTSAAREILASRELPAEEQLLLHRHIGADGRSRAWVNGVPVPLGVLRELGEKLVEIHGQNEHLALAHPEQQRILFDGWAGCAGQAGQVWSAAQRVREAQEALATAQSNDSTRADRVEFLRFQLRELETLAPRAEEYDSLFEQYERLRHREKMLGAIGTAVNALEDGESAALTMLSRARESLEHIPASAGLADSIELLAQAEALGSEVVQSLLRIADTESDPGEIDALNERIARYQTLARKHGVEPSRLHARQAAFEKELALLDFSEGRLQVLLEGYENACSTWTAAAKALSRERRGAAPRFAKAVAAAVRALGMPEASFEVALPAAAEGSYPATGAETVRFEVSTNAGQSLRPLGHVASGGELSRLALAIEVLAHRESSTPVMVFDEVDAGISGRVAELVGRQLKTLSRDTQVLCVTHLPQIGALADSQFAVRKASKSKKTSTEVVLLNGDQRIEAIAAMLGGVEVTDTARKHARELLAG